MISRLFASFDTQSVEPAGFEPASKHMPDKLSTCLSRNLISEKSQSRANLPFSYTALVSQL